MEDFWLDKTKSDNWSFRFFIRHELKWTIFRMSVRFAPTAASRELASFYGFPDGQPTWASSVDMLWPPVTYD